MKLTMRGKVTAYVLATAIAGTIGAVTISSPPSPDLPPCPTEDSVSCYWDAKVHGNGRGQSFTADALGNITYTG